MFNFKRKQYWQEIPELIKNRNADIFIVSYPKSGRSWLRFMLSRYFSYVYQIDFELSKDITELTKSVNSASKIAFVHDGSSYTQNYNFSYDELPKESKKIYKNKKVILLVRDLRDVMVSYYLHCSKRDNIYHKEISDFIRDRKFGIAKAVEFLNIWYLNRNIPEEFMVIQ